MTEGKPLDAARIALIRDRLGALLIEQPGAFDTYDTGVQLAAPLEWWDEALRRIRFPEFLAWIAKSYWPSQPLSGTLADHYSVSIAAWGIAARPATLVSWHGPGRSAEDMARARVAFDDSGREAADLVQASISNLARAGRLLDVQADARMAAAKAEYAADLIDHEDCFRTSRAAQDVLDQLTTFSESLWERTPRGLLVPKSIGQWREFETTVAKSLVDLGVEKNRVIEIFSSDNEHADPEDERARISLNLRRSAAP